MSGRIADYEKGSSSPTELIDSLSELRRQVRERDLRIRNLESLLDRILICLNAFGSGEGAYSLPTLVQAIAQEIAICRLLDADTDIPDA